MKRLIAILSVWLLMSSCIVAASRYYNTLEEYEIQILDKRYVPGFQNPDHYQFKVKEGNEYVWVNTTQKLYDSKQRHDTIRCAYLYWSVVTR